MTLTDFLLARIADDEAVAKAATSGEWSPETAPNGYPPMVVGNNMVVAETHDKPHLSDATHIARHAPARVLAECEAKRRIVGWHREADEGHCVDDQHYPMPCPTLAFLALPYVDHPDYRDEWRP